MEHHSAGVGPVIMTQRVLTSGCHFLRLIVLSKYIESRTILSKFRSALGPFILRSKHTVVLVLLLTLGVAPEAYSQNRQNPPAKSPLSKPNAHASVAGDAKRGFQGFLSDQKRIWTCPAHLKISDAAWVGRHTVEIRERGGQLERRYYVNGTEHPFEPEGRQWLHDNLPKFPGGRRHICAYGCT